MYPASEAQTNISKEAKMQTILMQKLRKIYPTLEAKINLF